MTSLFTIMAAPWAYGVGWGVSYWPWSSSPNPMARLRVVILDSGVYPQYCRGLSPHAKRILGHTTPIFLSDSNLLTNDWISNDLKMVSLLTKNRYRPVEALMPRLFPPAKPRFFSERMVFSCGYFCEIIAASSLFEALSTTITSNDVSLRGIVSINEQVSSYPL